MNQRSFIFFGEAELPWIYPLGTELARFAPTTLIRLGVSKSFRRNKINWPFDQEIINLERLWWNYPPGFNGKFARLFTHVIRGKLNRLILRNAKIFGESPYVIVTYPKFFPYLKDVDPQKLIYLNYDDYAVNFGLQGDIYLAEESFLVCQANTILCSSQYQARRFRQRFWEKVDRIFHLPHGVHEDFVNTQQDFSFERPTVCSIGRLSIRYDWRLIRQVITQLPDVQFLFVGDIIQTLLKNMGDEWIDNAEAVLSLPNVVHIKGLQYRDYAKYLWQSSVNWIPYQTSLAFVKSSCPLKLLDGIASGRPVMSADVPECRLYPEWVNIYRDSNEAVGLIQSALRKVGSPEAIEHSRKQIGFARRNTWASRAENLINILQNRN